MVYLIKMKVLTYKSYKEHCELYTKIHDLIDVKAVRSGLQEKK